MEQYKHVYRINTVLTYGYQKLLKHFNVFEQNKDIKKYGRHTFKVASQACNASVIEQRPQVLSLP